MWAKLQLIKSFIFLTLLNWSELLVPCRLEQICFLLFFPDLLHTALCLVFPWWPYTPLAGYFSSTQMLPSYYSNIKPE